MVKTAEKGSFHNVSGPTPENMTCFCFQTDVKTNRSFFTIRVRYGRSSLFS
jgi:hypothetical protein